jgi:hypothetical protein
MKSIISIATVSLKVVCTICVVLGAIAFPLGGLTAGSTLDGIWGVDEDEI